MKRFLKVGNAVAVMFFCCILCCTACGEVIPEEEMPESASEMATTSTISVKKDGSISSKIVEAFTEQSYYELDGLKSMIESSIAAYQAENAAAQVKLKSCKAKGDDVNVELEFGDYQSYAGFNDEGFFAGTVQAANKAGFDLNMTLKGAGGKQKDTTISKQDLLGMGDNHIVILEPSVEEEGATQVVRVECFDEILYVGDGVTATGKKSADVTVSDGYKVIVFR